MQMEDTRDIDYVTFVIWILACGFVVAVNLHRMNFFLAQQKMNQQRRYLAYIEKIYIEKIYCCFFAENVITTILFQ